MAAEFPYLSSSASSTESDRAPTAADVDTLISQTADLIVLEQIAALNTAHLSDSLLPTELETRFRKLKSFPGAADAKSRPPPPPRRPNLEIERAPAPPDDTKPQRTESTKPESPSAVTSAPGKPGGVKKELELELELDVDPKSRTGFLPPPSIWAISPPPSPPRRRGQGCCFGFSPRRSASRKKGSGNGTVMRGFGLDGDDELLSDLGSSSKEQRRRMNRAMREEKKASREAEKVVEWVKQASARMMDTSVIDELLIRDDDADGKIR